MKKILKLLYSKGFLKITLEVIEKASKNADLDLLLLGLVYKDFNIRIKAVEELSKYANQNDQVYEAICNTIHNDISIVSIKAINSLVNYHPTEKNKWIKKLLDKKGRLKRSRIVGTSGVDFEYSSITDSKTDLRLHVVLDKLRRSFIPNKPWYR
ncbi:hypothetical protein [Nonlabens dokdonensis]|uniref:hypothetical protein n=1 Tax=Nonlabens dokdonensis TaxID=328515 RepID=UPI0011B6C601|nr:hypothetical protein [Nonlabens dokdonensis]